MKLVICEARDLTEVDHMYGLDISEIPSLITPVPRYDTDRGPARLVLTKKRYVYQYNPVKGEHPSYTQVLNILWPMDQDDVTVTNAFATQVQQLTQRSTHTLLLLIQSLATLVYEPATTVSLENTDWIGTAPWDFAVALAALEKRLKKDLYPLPDNNLMVLDCVRGKSDAYLIKLDRQYGADTSFPIAVPVKGLTEALIFEPGILSFPRDDARDDPILLVYPAHSNPFDPSTHPYGICRGRSIGNFYYVTEMTDVMGKPMEEKDAYYLLKRLSDLPNGLQICFDVKNVVYEQEIPNEAQT